jgi:endonuclease/exonuclease/phosphatase family metal-dependent hydrolase
VQLETLTEGYVTYMLRILSYNILYGGKGRVNQLTKMIQSAQPDVLGLIEAADARVIEELAERLEMHYCANQAGEYPRGQRLAVLSRLPIIYTELHARPGILREPLLEVGVKEAGGTQFTVFVTHLWAAFNQGWAGNHIQQREVKEILRIAAAKQGMPHLLIGDFNALAPGDAFKGSQLLRHMVNLDAQRKQYRIAMQGQPNLNFVVPPRLRIFNPLLRVIPRSRLLCALFDVAASWYAPRGSIALLLKAGYLDCFRRMNPGAWGFTCPAGTPAGRIDFIFASPELAARLAGSNVITTGEGLPGEQASDHFPVCAEFREATTS